MIQFLNTWEYWKVLDQTKNLRVKGYLWNYVKCVELFSIYMYKICWDFDTEYVVHSKSERKESTFH